MKTTNEYLRKKQEVLVRTAARSMGPFGSGAGRVSIIVGHFLFLRCRVHVPLTGPGFAGWTGAAFLYVGLHRYGTVRSLEEVRRSVARSGRHRRKDKQDSNRCLAVSHQPESGEQ